ncbi:MAG: HAD family phosphatase [Clostridia bacterium]|nr:HAD family phosphatase [Clostridia bacterium]
MIKNIVFDLGGVLIDFKPEKYLEHIGYSEEEVSFFTTMIFWSSEWSEYNSSKYDDRRTKENLIKRNPQYASEIENIFNKIDYQYILFEKKDTVHYLKELKSRGYHIYLLSDLSIDSYNYNKQFDFFNDIIGGVYSFEVGSTKPNKKNYETLLSKYQLIPEETIFIDDRLENVKAADNCGIHGIQFTTLEDVKEQITILEKG